MELQGIEWMGENVKEKLRYCGEDVIIYPLAKLTKPESISLGKGTQVSDFCFIHAAGGTIEIGEYCIFEPMSQIWGTGKLKVGNFVSFGPGVVLMSQGYDYRTCGTMAPVGRSNLDCVIRTDLTIGDHVYFGANSTVLSTVKHIGEGAIIGANALVNRDLEPWGVYVGVPAKKIGERPKTAISPNASQ